jgi:hypothetical protein
MPKMTQSKQTVRPTNNAPTVTRKRISVVVGGTVSNGRLTGLTSAVIDSSTNNYRIYIDVAGGHNVPLVDTNPVLCQP